MKRKLFFVLIVGLLTSCGTTKNTASTAPIAQRVPAKFDFSPPSRAQAGSTGITIAIVKPTYVGKNPEYLVAPFNEMAARMGNNSKEHLTPKAFPMQAPSAPREKRCINIKLIQVFVLESGMASTPNTIEKYPLPIKP